MSCLPRRKFRDSYPVQTRIAHRPRSCCPDGRSGNGARGDGRTGATGLHQAYRGESYYEWPAVKASHYRWLVATYLFVGGLAGAAQLIATVADLLGQTRDRTIVRTGRYLALVGAMVSPVLLILDLHYPRRWFNMLAIFRSTSPMSIGSWTLLGFGTLSGLAAVGQALEDLLGATIGRQMARLFGLPAAASGAMTSIYTGTLLATTSVPLWASAHRLLPAWFGASSTASASAALSLILNAAGAPKSIRRRLERLSLVAAAAELGVALAMTRRWTEQRLATPLERQPIKGVYYVGVLGLGMIGPLIVHAVQTLTGRHSRTMSSVADIATLAGAYAERAVVIFAGNNSARRPTDYFEFTQPSELATNGAGATAPAPRAAGSYQQ
ncbi:MAG TPA: polysulfide reductase NrfD [Chloroflexi bacterium]|nr:polysulfide reductase NrfD [Chloroflexota bacterium]